MIQPLPIEIAGIREVVPVTHRDALEEGHQPRWLAIR
jgi:hypothetical protein